ncbi:MAG: Fe-S cluster assembly protein HesB [Candidatus Nanoarchaeia archaeon]
MIDISCENKEKFISRILDFYKEQGRDLPWRKTTDPYAILVSEVMLQQTQVSRVVEKYIEWMRLFPTVDVLAHSSLQVVLRAWSGLGYNSRGKRLQDAARMIVEEFGGCVPVTIDNMQKLPGVGPYTARSVLIFAKNEDIATVDTNIRRIFIAEFGKYGVDEQTSDADLFLLAEELLPKSKSRDWHNALMDYGATILTARKTKIKPRTTQSTFKGSRREYRAKIIKYLTINNSITITQAQKLCSDCTYDVKEIIGELQKEGLVQKTKRGFCLQK